mmetsp:Transcript_17272/g.37835  ORF Transcript_17272/g.37835 Transcript_17272/m.37835 type:complete len:237 (-) Transcript_17272:72-782(-)
MVVREARLSAHHPLGPGPRRVTALLVHASLGHGEALHLHHVANVEALRSLMIGCAPADQARGQHLHLAGLLRALDDPHVPEALVALAALLEHRPLKQHVAETTVSLPDRKRRWILGLLVVPPLSVHVLAQRTLPVLGISRHRGPSDRPDQSHRRAKASGHEACTEPSGSTLRHWSTRCHWSSRTHVPREHGAYGWPISKGRAEEGRGGCSEDAPGKQNRRATHGSICGRLTVHGWG